MRIVIDLDGTICELKSEGESYADLAPKPGASERIAELRAAGHTVVIHTARNMATTGGNVGKAVANIGKITLDWLSRHGIEYDEICFGKPNAEVYLDDRAVRFSSWAEISSDYLAKVARPR